MQIVSTGDNLHEMSTSVFLVNMRKIFQHAERFIQGAKR